MSSYALPTNSGQLIGLGNKMLGGLTSLGVTLGITQITPAEFAPILATFADQDNAFNAGRSTRQAASDLFQSNAATLTAWLGVVRTVLAGQFGQRWNTAWAQAGFINNTTQIPTKTEDRIALAGRVIAFFTANPSAEVPSMQVTAAQGTALQSATLTAQTALTAATMALSTLSQSWTDAYNALTDEMWSLIKILQATLNDDDPRWLAFGLQMPITSSTPGQPVNLTAHTDNTGALIVACDPVPLATRYRWRMLLVGIESDYVLAASSVDPIGTITGVLPGETAQIIVQAVNGSLQGVPSDPIVFTMPPAAAKATHAPEVPAKNGHANRNGHTIANGNSRPTAHTRVA